MGTLCTLQAHPAAGAGPRAAPRSASPELPPTGFKQFIFQKKASKNGLNIQVGFGRTKSIKGEIKLLSDLNVNIPWRLLECLAQFRVKLVPRS